MVHKPSDKRKQSKHIVRAAKSNRRTKHNDSVQDVPTSRLPGSEHRWIKREDGKVEFDASQLVADKFLGLVYQSGKQDCGTLIRDFYAENFGMLFPNYARPDDWWRKGMNLFTQIYRAEGFRPMDITLREMQIGDVMLMGYGSPFPNHSGVYVGEGKILQHLHGKLSNKEHIRSHHRDALLAIVRHPDIIVKMPPAPKIDLLDMISPYWKGKLSEKLGGANDEEIKAEVRRLGAELLGKEAPAAAQS